MRRIKTRELLHRVTASLLCLSMLISMMGGVGSLKAMAEPSGAVPTDVKTREADPNTMETYKGKLLSDSEGGSSETTGSRYAGRVWSDKSVVAHDNNRNFQELELKMEDDGYKGSVNFNADFLHIYSTLTSSQVVNEYPPSPIDLVIVFDMSGSMGQDIRYGIDAGGNGYVPHNPAGTSGGYRRTGLLKGCPWRNVSSTPVSRLL